MARNSSNSTPGRARRDPVASRARLLKAGLKLFSKRGPDATTVEMLSHEARINRRMLYHYFGSKEGLYRVVIEQVYRESAEIEVELSHILSPVDKLLARIIRSYYDYMQRHPEFVRLLAWENLRRGRTARIRLQNVRARNSILKLLICNR